MAVPVLALVLSLWLMTHAGIKSWLVTAVFMACGALMYRFTRRNGNGSES
jgi:uncharacterized membrane protein YhhN